MSVSSRDPNEEYQIKNQRPDEDLEEHEIYEKLCRQNQTEVDRSIRIHASSYLRLSLVKFPTSIEIILSLST